MSEIGRSGAAESAVAAAYADRRRRALPSGIWGAALFVDTRSLSFEQLALPRETAILVINSGIAHANAASVAIAEDFQRRIATRIQAIRGDETRAGDALSARKHFGARHRCSRSCRAVSSEDRDARAIFQRKPLRFQFRLQTAQKIVCLLLH